MNTHKARKLSQYHKFTKKELFDILEEALASHKDEYWESPNKTNKIFDNGAYFNLCVKWVGYKKGENDDELCSTMVAFRVLDGFGEFSKTQIPEKEKPVIQIQKSEKPSLNLP
jgi:hypothetical protein